MNGTFDDRETIVLEENRLKSLYEYGILDTQAVQELDLLTQFTARLLKAPIGLITLIDKNRQWFKSRYGIDVNETPRDIAFCDYTIRGDEVFEIQDTLKDPRFNKNPLVLNDPNIRFYAGAPLKNEAGYKLGSLAIVDRMPRSLNKEEKEILKLLAKQVTNYFELNHKKNYLEREIERRTWDLKNKVLELEQKEKELKMSNSELDNFVYTASHDLKAPISNIEGLLNFLTGSLNFQCKDDSDVSEAFEMMRQSVQRFKNTVYDLTEISQAKKLKDSNADYVNFHEILVDVISSINDLAQITNAKINEDFSEVIDLRFGKKELRSIMYNLLSNALKYKSPLRDPEITIRSERNNGWVVLSVKDNGVGISQENIEKIFLMFKRLQSNVEGSGVGLYLVRKVVDSSGGKIEVDSEPGKGTEFRIFFKQ